MHQPIIYSFQSVNTTSHKSSISGSVATHPTIYADNDFIMQVDSQSVDPVQYVEQQRSHSEGDAKAFWEKLGKAYEKK
jgi:hypothetical protein